MAGKRFQFSLQRVLELRQHEAEAAEQVLGTAVQRRAEGEATVAEAQARLEAFLQAESHLQSGLLDLRRREGFRRDARRAVEQAERMLASLRRQEDQARQQLRRRKQAEDALTTLRDEQLSTFQAEAAREDLAFLDEQALSGYLRKRTP